MIYPQAGFAPLNAAGTKQMLRSIFLMLRPGGHGFLDSPAIVPMLRLAM
jgi:hypothetical protein